MAIATRRRGTALVTITAIVCLAGALLAQRRRFDVPGQEPEVPRVRYDGRVTFARLKYETGPGGYYYYGLPAWAHGYVSVRGGGRAEENLMKIMNEISYLNPRIEDSVVLALDDPELSKYPADSSSSMTSAILPGVAAGGKTSRRT